MMQGQKNSVPVNFVPENEMQLLIAMSKYLIDKSNRLQVENSLKQKIDWLKFIKFFRKHKLSGVVAATINDFAEFIPATVKEKLTFIFDKHQKRMLKLTGQMLLINRSFKQHNIKSAWLKGPLLAQQLWNNSFIRSSVDIDILIDIEQLHEIDALLSGLGYKPGNDWKKFTGGFFKKWQGLTHHVLYHNPVNKISVEIHWRLTTPKSMFNVSVEKLLSETHTIKLQQHDFEVLSHEYNNAFILIHAASHSWECISWLLDIAVLLKKDPKTGTQLSDFIRDNNYSGTLQEGINMAKYLFLDENIKLSQKELQTLANVCNLDHKLTAYKIASSIAGFKKDIPYKLGCFKKNYFYLPDIEKHRLPHRLFFLYYVLTPFLWLKRTKNAKK